jgi:3-hydroxy-D-aspartate aldolase
MPRVAGFAAESPELPVSPELVLVSPPEEARRARERLPEMPGFVPVREPRRTPQERDRDWEGFLADLRARELAVQHIEDVETRREAIGRAIEGVRRTVELLGAAGLSCELVSGAGTGSYRFEAASGVYTEVQAGSYIFMDLDYRRVGGFPGAFEHALFVLATVMSRPTKDRAIVDAGLKAFSVDKGLPAVRGMADVECVRAADEHGKLILHDAERGLRIGDKLWLIPGHCDPTVNLYDWYVGVRGGRVEALWPITARGAIT